MGLNIVDIGLLIVIGIVLVFALGGMHKRHKEGGSCCGDCCNCSSNCNKRESH